jgi:lipopolysaccharide/colanic/teichoic acid biosynthesis glycosyltransferase
MTLAWLRPEPIRWVSAWSARASIVSRRATYLALKRLIDIGGSVTLIVVLAPITALIALAIKAQDGGPVLFWQRRVGRHGREFPFPKLRSMVPNAEAIRQQILHQNHHGQSVTFKLKDDPRITPVGKLIRRYSLDELPQLWCVLRGDMSLVGPRPPLPNEVSHYRIQHRRRLDAKPGLTCIWQVSGRGDIPFDQQWEQDVQYVESASLALDLRLLLMTLPAVLSGRGAY